MNQTAHDPGCKVCQHWQRRIDEERARAKRGCTSAFSEEKRVRRELDEHLERRRIEAHDGAEIDADNAGVPDVRTHMDGHSAGAGSEKGAQTDMPVRWGNAPDGIDRLFLHGGGTA